MKHIKKIMAVMMIFCAVYAICNLYIIRAAYTGHTITGISTSGENVTLYECRTRDDETILLETAKPGKTYTIIVNGFGTYLKEDDLILLAI